MSFLQSQSLKTERINDLLRLRDSLLDRSISSGNKLNSLVNVAAGYHFKTESIHTDSKDPFLFVHVADSTFVSMDIEKEAIPFLDKLLAILQR